MNSRDPGAVMIGLLIGTIVGTLGGVGLFRLGLYLWERRHDRHS